MTDENKKNVYGDEFNLTGDFRGAIVNIKATLTNVTQSVNNIHNASKSDKEELQNLVQSLGDALSDVPAEKVEDAEIVTDLTEELVQQAEEEQPKRRLLEIKGENLKKAAENLASVTPQVVTIASQIVGLILKMKFGA